MKGGVGGPLLCISDLLSDLEESATDGAVSQPQRRIQPSSPILQNSENALRSSDLPKLFQEHYDRLDEALTGTGHSWTALTLELCAALETANELVRSTNSNATLLSIRVAEFQKVVKRGDSAVAAAKAIHFSLNLKGGASHGSQNDQ